VRANVGSNNLVFKDAIGPLVGDLRDDDTPETRILWFTTAKLWTGAYNNNWSNYKNWADYTVPTINDKVILNHAFVLGPYQVNIDSIDAVAKQLIIDYLH